MLNKKYVKLYSHYFFSTQYETMHKEKTKKWSAKLSYYMWC